MPDKWTYRFFFKEESPGSTRDTVPGNTWRGDPRDSATENKPP